MTRLLLAERDRLQAWHRRLRDPGTHRNVAAKLRRLDDHIGRVERDIARLLVNTGEFAAVARLLLSIPGVGQVLAVKVCALGDIRHVGIVRKLCAHADIIHQRTQSDASIDRTRISRRGDRKLRMIAYRGALSASMHNPVVHAFAEDLARRPGLYRKQVIAACGHKLLRIVYGVLTSRKPSTPPTRDLGRRWQRLGRDDDRASSPSPAGTRRPRRRRDPRPRRPSAMFPVAPAARRCRSSPALPPV